MELTNRENSSQRNTSRRTWRFFLVGLGILSVTVCIPTVPIFVSKAPGPAGPVCIDQGLLSPDITFGNMTFTKAKAIDLSWNLAAGHGIQALTGFVTYRIAADALLRIIELVPVSYETFATMSFNPPVISSLIPLLRAILETRRWRAKTILIFLFICALYTLALPTLLDSATGYIQVTEIWVNWMNGTMTRLNDDKWSNVSDLDDGTKVFQEGDKIYPISCIPTPMYQWGFCFVWTAVVISLFIVWAWSCYGIWVDSHKSSYLLHQSGRIGQWRAVADLGTAMHEDLGPNLSCFSDSGLRNQLRHAPLLKYTMLVDQGWGTQRVRLSSW